MHAREHVADAIYSTVIGAEQKGVGLTKINYCKEASQYSNKCIQTMQILALQMFYGDEFNMDTQNVFWY